MKKQSETFNAVADPNDEFENINNKILNYSLFISSIFSLPAVISLYFRSKIIGLELFTKLKC